MRSHAVETNHGKSKYRSIAQGKRRSSQVGNSVSNMTDLASELPRALEQNEIVPYYQPLVDLHTSRIIGFEALARWHHPIGKVIHPPEFIPLIEKSGLDRKRTRLNSSHVSESRM